MPWRRSTRAGCTGTPRRGRCMAGILRPKHVNRICFQSGRRGTILSMRGDFASAPGISLRTIPTITRSVIPPLPIVVCGRSAPAFRPRALLAARSRFGLAGATDVDVRSPSLQLANFHGGHALGHKHGRGYTQILRDIGHCRTVVASRKRGHPRQWAARMACAQGVGRAPHLERSHGTGVFHLQVHPPTPALRQRQRRHHGRRRYQVPNAPASGPHILRGGRPGAGGPPHAGRPVGKRSFVSRSRVKVVSTSHPASVTARVSLSSSPIGGAHMPAIR